MSTFLLLATLAQISNFDTHFSSLSSSVQPIIKSPIMELAVVNPAVGGKDYLQLGLNYYQQEQFAKAVEIQQQAVMVFKNQGDRLQQSQALNYLALGYQQLGKLRDAENAIAQSLELLKAEVDSPEKLSLQGQALNNQGKILLARGEVEKALTSWQEATKIYQRMGYREGIIGSKLNQTQALQALGFYRRTLMQLDEVYQDINSLGDENPQDALLKVKGLLNIGNTLRVLGNLRPVTGNVSASLTSGNTFQNNKSNQNLQIEKLDSESVLKQALEIAKKSNFRELEAEINLALGNTFYALAKSVSGDLSDTESDEYKQKSQYIETALNYYQQTATDGVSRDTSIQGKLNQLRLQLEAGEWSAAQNLWQEIQPQLANLAPNRKNIYARINLAQSLTCLKQGTDGTAKVITFSCPEFSGDRQKNLQVTDGIPWKTIYQVVETAVQDAEALKDTRAHAYALGTLGSLYEQTKQWKEAQTITQRAISIAEGIQASDITYRWQWQLGRILKEQGKEKEKSAIAAYAKAVNHLKSLRRDLALLNRDVQFSFRQEVEPVYREYVSLLLRSHQQESDPQKQQAILQEARNTIESLNLAELDNFFRRACLDGNTEVSLQQIDTTASVVYPIILPDSLAVIVSLPNQDSGLKENKSGGEEILKLKQYFAQDLPLGKSFQNTIQSLRDSDKALANRQSDEDEYLPAAQQVYQWLIKPFESDWKKYQIQNLVFVLDGYLRNIPMAALHDGKQFLVEKSYNLAVSPGLRLLPPKKVANRVQVKLFAGGLSELNKSNNPRHERFEPLENVKNELKAITEIFPSSQKIINQELTNQNILQQIQSFAPSVVSLATHGLFSSTAENTYVLSWDSVINVNDFEGLLKNPQNPENVIDLLVLSACQTASGDDKAALGLAGVAIQSGARSTIATLWNVSDEATKLLMVEFFRQLRENPNISKAEALKRAQIYLLKLEDGKYKHPYYWSPIILVGNWL